jgi:hypothetical protein
MRIVAALVLALCLSAPSAVRANPLCRAVGVCLYASPGFELTVLDAATGAPLPGVYGWAEWVQYGTHGIGGAVMVQDVVSGPDGRLVFPRWGPTLGSRAGLVLGSDPAVILFKPGYTTLLVDNVVPPGASQHAMRRGFRHDGQRVRLPAFGGSPAEWVEELRRLIYPALSSYVSEAARTRFREAYRRRLTRARAELGRLPADLAEATQLRIGLEQSARFIEGDDR